MLVIGTEKEEFTSPWVKNEWSRYLAMMRDDREKLLIPCYRDMDAYDLPEELGILQSQDMSKIGFEQDLLRGIKKIIGKNDPKSDILNLSKEKISALLQRCNDYIEDNNWEMSEEYCNRVLEIEPKCADAYLRLFLIRYRLHSIDEVLNDYYHIDEYEIDSNINRAIEYGNDEIKNQISSIFKQARQKDDNEKDEIYNRALTMMKDSTCPSDFHNAALEFDKLNGCWKDSNSKRLECLEREEYTLREEYNKKEAAIDKDNSIISKELNRLSRDIDSAQHERDSCEQQISNISKSIIKGNPLRYLGGITGFFFWLIFLGIVFMVLGYNNTPIHPLLEIIIIIMMPIIIDVIGSKIEKGWKQEVSRLKVKQSDINNSIAEMTDRKRQLNAKLYANNATKDKMLSEIKNFKIV